MTEFSEKWPSFTDYIIEITREIWDDRKVLTLHDYYAKDILVRTPGGLSVGVEATIRGTYATIGQAPHRTSGAEDVIWSCDDTGHFYSSHRNVDIMVHDRDDIYGPATHRKIWYWIIADCAARDDMIDDEWLIRDSGGVVRQLGWDPKDFARHQIEIEGGPETCTKPLTAEIDRPGPYKGRGNDNEWGAKYADILNRVMAGDLSAIPENYDEQCHCIYAGGQTSHCPDAVNAFWAQVRSAFSDAKFTIHHTIGRHDDLMSPRAALRWTLEGRHDGWGAFGRPTGAEVYVMGICHAEFGPRGIRREYALFDEVAIWKQILLQIEGQSAATGAPARPDKPA
ncbi:ester cyclase [Oceaniglobus trochenteri]|uniref:nuclear transport factor 2 family protein n=1 Tax=Oceaniglobus trochenteri TaxID=2763260 RepID=UPI001CFF993C|nr:ester cyclase [Oceaniglobus trochenteri]